MCYAVLEADLLRRKIIRRFVWTAVGMLDYLAVIRLRLPHRHSHSPTINVERRSSDVGGIVANQEGNRRGYLFRTRSAFHNA